MSEEIPWGQYQRAFRQLYKGVLPPNRAKKFVVDLSEAKTDVSLKALGLLPDEDIYTHFTVFKIGTGSWSFKMEFANGSTIEYLSSELSDNYLIVRRFVDILFTNEVQAVTNPKFIVEWIR